MKAAVKSKTLGVSHVLINCSVALSALSLIQQVKALPVNDV